MPLSVLQYFTIDRLWLSIPLKEDVPEALQTSKQKLSNEEAKNKQSMLLAFIPPKMGG